MAILERTNIKRTNPAGLDPQWDTGTGVFDARSSRTIEVSSLLHRLPPLLGGFPSPLVSFPVNLAHGLLRSQQVEQIDFCNWDDRNDFA